MNPYKHSLISVKRCKGCVEDYYEIHNFIDSTKQLCSDNRHRIFHTIWAVDYLVQPIFGHTIINSDGRRVCVKDICEKDHILPDYRYAFIPTLGDFVAAFDIKLGLDWKKELNRLHKTFALDFDKRISRLMLSPLAMTGRLESLFITHNSWFINSILPRLTDNYHPIIDNFAIAPASWFETMKFELWMDNGVAYPPSVSGLKYSCREIGE